MAPPREAPSPPSQPPPPGAAGGPPVARVAPNAREYRVDELAREAGTTVRNVRAYQDRGLLPPPRRQGRVGLYSDAHLARLRLIADLLGRGYTLANIAELVSAWERGRNVGAVLGLEAALGGPWDDHPVEFVTAAELAAGFGEGVEPFIADAVDVGLLEQHPDGRFRVTNPAALEVGKVLVAAGVPLVAVLDVARALRTDVADVGQRFVALVEDHVVAPLGAPLAAADLQRLAALVAALRPLVTTLVHTELARAMDEEIRRRLGEHLEHLEHLGQLAQLARTAHGRARHTEMP